MFSPDFQDPCWALNDLGASAPELEVEQDEFGSAQALQPQAYSFSGKGGYGVNSVSSTSPVSLTFSSHATSTQYAGSLGAPSIYSNGIDIGVDIQDNNFDILNDVSEAGLSKTHSSTIQNWVQYDPIEAKRRPDKAMRSCLLCYKRNHKCLTPDDPNRCIYCADESTYCKGPMKVPHFINGGKFSLQRDRDSTDNAPDTLLETTNLKFTHYSNPSYVLAWQNYHTRLEGQVEAVADGVTGLPAHALQLPELGQEFPYIAGFPQFDSLLDSISRAGVKRRKARPATEGKPCYSLSLFESLCGRICFCLMLLRSPHKCSIKSLTPNPFDQARAIVAFQSYLCLESSRLFERIFVEVETCYLSDRKSGKNKSQTLELMSTLASGLGRVHVEIGLLGRTANQWHQVPFAMSKVFSDTPVTQMRLQYYGKAFDAEAFNTGATSIPLNLPGVHLSIGPTSVEPTLLCLCDEGLLFQEVLMSCDRLEQYMTTNTLAPVAAVTEDPTPKPVAEEVPLAASASVYEFTPPTDNEVLDYPDQPQELQVAIVQKQNEELEEQIRSLQAQKAANEVWLNDLQTGGIHNPGFDRSSILYDVNSHNITPPIEVLEDLVMPDYSTYFADPLLIGEGQANFNDTQGYNFHTMVSPTGFFDGATVATEDSATSSGRSKKRRRVSPLTFTDPFKNEAIYINDMPNTAASLPQAVFQDVSDHASDSAGDEDLPARRYSWPVQRIRKSVEISVKTLAKSFDKVRL